MKIRKVFDERDRNREIERRIESKRVVRYMETQREKERSQEGSVTVCPRNLFPRLLGHTV